jgi:hypothetical protein
MAAVRLGCSRANKLRQDAQAHPPRGELWQTCEGRGAPGRTVVSTETLGEPQRVARAGDHGLGLAATA